MTDPVLGHVLVRVSGQQHLDLKRYMIDDTRLHLTLPSEDAIKEHFEGRLTQMNNQVIFADSKAATFHDECVALMRQIEVSF